MMRSNLENNLARSLRHTGQKFTVVRQALTGVLVLLNGSANVHFLNPGATSRTVYLPPYISEGGQQLWLFNTGSAGSLDVVDANGVSIGSVQPGTVGCFFEDSTTWRYFTGPQSLALVIQIITGATGTISVGTELLIVNRTAPVTTSLTMPTAASRSGRKLAILDYSQTVTGHTITLTPALVAQKIMRQTTWTLFSNAASLAAQTFIPIVDPDDSSNYVWVYAP